MMNVDSGNGSARRRRERLRSMLRHDRQTVAVALAEANHHSAPRRPTTARTEATNDALRSQVNSMAGETELVSLYEDEFGGTQPDRPTGVRPQEWAQRHTVEQIGDISVYLSDQLTAVFKRFDTAVPEQIVAVPKISWPSRPLRAAIAATQMVEQLVEVPVRRISWLECLSLRWEEANRTTGQTCLGVFELCQLPAREATASPGRYTNTGRRPWYRAAAVPAVQVHDAVHRQIAGHSGLRLVRTGRTLQRTGDSAGAG